MTTVSRNRVLGATAFVLGAGAVVAGDPRASGARHDEFVSAVSVAEWLRERQPLQLIDVRSADSFNEFHVPRAMHVPLVELSGFQPDPAATVVVYGAESRISWRAKRILEKTGHRRVLVLDGGVRAWLFEIISPTVSRHASGAEREAFDRVAELSRYFGGVPRVIDGSDDRSAASTSSMLEATRRRSCAF
jgi:rhodanese-related sulfurtransferase